jgi:hypothetical protein
MLLQIQKQNLKQKQNKLENRSYESRFNPALFFFYPVKAVNLHRDYNY